MEEKSNQRTDQQRKALEVWCRELATELNERGLTFKKVVKEAFDIDWTQEMVKEVFWRTWAKVKFGKEHTSDLTTAELQEIYDENVRLLSAPRFDGIYMPFPSKDADYENYKTFNTNLDQF